MPATNPWTSACPRRSPVSVWQIVFDTARWRANDLGNRLGAGAELRRRAAFLRVARGRRCAAQRAQRVLAEDCEMDNPIRQLAQLHGIADSYLGLFAAGRKQVSIESQTAILAALGVEPATTRPPRAAIHRA